MKAPVTHRVQLWLQKRFLSLAGLDHLMDMAYFGEPTYTGKSVNAQSAMEYTALFTCVRILSETLAYMPLILYRRMQPRGKERASDHPLYSLLHDQPNPEMTSYTWRETMQAHLATWGNAYSEIEFDVKNGRVKALWPLRPDKMDLERKNGKLFYIQRLPDGTPRGIPSYRVLHIKGMGFDGLIGYSPVSMFRQAISMGLSVEEYGSRFFASGGKPGGVLKHPNKLKTEARDNLRKSWQEMHSGLSNQHRIAILEEGMDYTQIGIPPEDAQFLATREFQLREMARIYRIPPHMLADLGRVTYNNIEHMGIDFVVHTMGPWLRRWEQEMAVRLLGEAERKQYFAEFLVEGLLRGDTATRFQAYSTARQWGWMSANDVRELENQNPLPDDQGDIYLVPMNMVPADMVRETEPQPRVTPEQTEEDSRASDMLRFLVEQRSLAAKNRSKLAQRYEPIMRDAAQRIVSREIKDIRRAIKKHLGERDSTDFYNWLEKFYQDAPEWMRRVIAPVVAGFADIVQASASSEIGAEPGITPELQALIGELTGGYIRKYTGQSFGQLKELLRESAAEGVPPAELIEERMENWEELRANKVAEHEAVFQANAVAKAVFVAAGFTRLMWVAAGSDTCPYCQELDGRIVGSEQPFVGASESLESEDGRMTISKPALQPPLHRGCVCTLQATR